IPNIVNAGLGLANGEYVVVCHDHDLYEPDLLEQLATALDHYPSASFVHCGVIVVDAQGTREKARFVHEFAPLEPGRSFLINQLLPGIACPVAGLSMIRRSAIGARYMD